MGTGVTDVPAYVSRSTLAARLEISEGTVDEYVRRGILPKPVRLSPGCVRWRWETVDQALASLGGQRNDCASPSDMEDVRRAIQATKDRGRGRAA